jgi:hypothetical protein
VEGLRTLLPLPRAVAGLRPGASAAGAACAGRAGSTSIDKPSCRTPRRNGGPFHGRSTSWARTRTLLIQSRYRRGSGSGQVARKRSLTEHRCPLPCPKMPGSARRNCSRNGSSRRRVWSGAGVSPRCQTRASEGISAPRQSAPSCLRRGARGCGSDTSILPLVRPATTLSAHGPPRNVLFFRSSR